MYVNILYIPSVWLLNLFVKGQIIARVERYN